MQASPSPASNSNDSPINAGRGWQIGWKPTPGGMLAASAPVVAKVTTTTKPQAVAAPKTLATLWLK